jgi:hypothetical protein
MANLQELEEVTRLMLAVHSHKFVLLARSVPIVDLAATIMRVCDEPIALLNVQTDNVPSERVVLVELSDQRPSAIALRLTQIFNSHDFDGKTVIFIDYAETDFRLPVFSWTV